MMRSDPKMPRSVAEYNAARINAMRDTVKFSYLSHEYAGVTNVDSLAKLSPAEAAARWLQAKDPQWQMTHSPYGDPACAALPAKYQAHLRRTVVATATADSTGYVIYDQNVVMAGDSTRDMRTNPSGFLNVLVLNRRAGRWVVRQPETLYGSSFSMSCGRMDSSAAKKPPR
jgi:hypothetical protein